MLLFHSINEKFVVVHRIVPLLNIFHSTHFVMINTNVKMCTQPSNSGMNPTRTLAQFMCIKAVFRAEGLTLNNGSLLYTSRLHRPIIPYIDFDWFVVAHVSDTEIPQCRRVYRGHGQESQHHHKYLCCLLFFWFILFLFICL